MSLDQIAAGALVRARPWDVIGAALAAPMVIWGFLGWFGTVGDAGSGSPGFYAGAGATGIGLVFAASALTLSQLLEGRPHTTIAPPTAAFLAGAASVIILGGMIAKPDSATIQAGSVAGLLTALSQAVVLVMGWLRGSDKVVRAANVRALHEQQAAADQAASQRYGGPGYGQQGYAVLAPQPSGYPGQYGQPAYPAGQYSSGQYPAGQYPAASYSAGQYPAGQNPAGQYPPASYPAGQNPGGQYPQASYPPAQNPGGQYPQAPYPTGQYPSAQYPPPGPNPPSAQGQPPQGQPSPPEDWRRP